MTLREVWRAKVEIHVYQLTAVLLVLTILWAGGIYGLWRNNEAQRDADVAQCEQLVEDHNAVRDVLISLLGEDAVVVLDADYPQLDAAVECDGLGG